MKRTYLVIVTIAIVCTKNYCFSQASEGSKTSSQILSNGVVVHSAVGVEGVVLTNTEMQNIQNAQEDWTSEQIREALEYIRVKKNENCSSKELLNYEEQLIILENRLKVIESNK